MSWDCPHQNSDYTCERLQGACVPFCKGCVLYGQSQLLGTDADRELATPAPAQEGRPARSAGVLAEAPTLRAHVLQHVPFEGLGSIEPWLAARKARLSCTRFYEDPRLPDATDFDLLIALGGPMSVNDEERLPWLRDEKRLIASAVASGKAVLGICLGAQLIASARGARVYPGRHKEIGWFPVYADGADAGAFPFPPEFLAFHWHGETYDLPAGSTRLAHTTPCLNQAFQIGRRVIGLQFHLETTPASADAIIARCRDELVPGPYVQPEETLRGAPPHAFADINTLMVRLLDYLSGQMLDECPCA